MKYTRTKRLLRSIMEDCFKVVPAPKAKVMQEGCAPLLFKDGFGVGLTCRGEGSDDIVRIDLYDISPDQT